MVRVAPFFDSRCIISYLIELLLKLRRIIIDVIDTDDDVSSCYVPTIKYLHK